MLFVPDGIGGLVSMHVRRLHGGAIKHLVLPYLLCAAVGLLIIAGVVFTVESVYVLLSDAYSRNGVLPAAASCLTSCSNGNSIHCRR